MARVLGEKIITSIDVGTTKICVFIARHLDGDAIDIIGMSRVPSDGLEKGVVVDMPRAIHSIQSAVREAELMAGMPIEHAYVGISGAHIHSINSEGVVPIKQGEITQKEVDAVIASAQAVPVQEGQQIIHVLPQYFIIDGRDKVLDPVGMHGVRLEVKVHIVLGSVASVQNLVRCCERAGVSVRDIVLEQLASADAVLSADERELGVGVLDIGGGTADFAVYHKGTTRYTCVVPVAGNHFTHDLAVGLRTTLHDAETVKCTYGIACMERLERNECIELAQVQGSEKQRIEQAQVVRVLEPRAYELMRLVHRQMVEHSMQPFMTTGLVLTGGGSLLRGLDTVATTVFGMPVRIGVPQVMFDLPETIQTPIYATGYGILVHAVKKEQSKKNGTHDGPFLLIIVNRMKQWMKDFF